MKRTIMLGLSLFCGILAFGSNSQGAQTDECWQDILLEGFFSTQGDNIDLSKKFSSVDQANLLTNAYQLTAEQITEQVNKILRQLITDPTNLTQVITDSEIRDGLNREDLDELIHACNVNLNVIIPWYHNAETIQLLKTAVEDNMPYVAFEVAYSMCLPPVEFYDYVWGKILSRPDLNDESRRNLFFLVMRKRYSQFDSAKQAAVRNVLHDYVDFEVDGSLRYKADAFLQQINPAYKTSAKRQALLDRLDAIDLIDDDPFIIPKPPSTMSRLFDKIKSLLQ